MNLNPVVLPLPIAQAALALLAYAALRHTDRWPTYPTVKPPRPRHRLTSTREPYRPRTWDEIVATPISAPPVIEVEIDYDPLDHRVPLAEIERRNGWPSAVIVVPGIAQWRHELTAFEWNAPSGETRQLVAA